MYLLCIDMTDRKRKRKRESEGRKVRKKSRIVNVYDDNFATVDIYQFGWCCCFQRIESKQKERNKQNKIKNTPKILTIHVHTCAFGAKQQQQNITEYDIALNYCFEKWIESQSIAVFFFIPFFQTEIDDVFLFFKIIFLFFSLKIILAFSTHASKSMGG